MKLSQGATTAVLLLLMATACAAPSAAPPPGKQLGKVTIALGGMNLNYSAILIAKEAGYFKDAGLEVEITTMGGGAPALAATLGGSVQANSGSITELISAVQQGQPAKMVVALSRGFPADIVVRPDALQKRNVTPQSPLPDRIKALKGMKIGTSSPGGGLYQMLAYLARQNGMDPNKDIELVATRDNPSSLAALEKGSIDAMFMSHPAPEMAEAAKSGVKFIKISGGEIPELFNLANLGVFARTDYIQSNPEIAKAMVKAIARGQKLLGADKAKAKQHLKTFFKEMPQTDFDAAFDAVLPTLFTDPVLQKDVFQLTATYMSKFPGAKAIPAYEDLVDVRYAQQASQDLK
ncbi:MAG: ABC transporter substrate-binding protein [Chloroflexi bacterium]|nr:ABC transporter substrate-binding protein [Chloroflexota bacterium]